MSAVAGLPATERVLRGLLPSLTALVAILIDALPLPDASPQTPAPLLTVAVVAFWVLHRPDLMSPPRVFLLGLAADAVLGLPLGLSGLSLLAAAAAVGALRRHVRRQPFLAAWVAFALLAALVEALRWAVIGAFDGRLPPVWPAVLEATLTGAFWPPVSLLLTPLAHILPAPDHAPGD